MTLHYKVQLDALQIALLYKNLLSTQVIEDKLISSLGEKEFSGFVKDICISGSSPDFRSQATQNAAFLTIKTPAYVLDTQKTF